MATTLMGANNDKGTTGLPQYLQKRDSLMTPFTGGLMRTPTPQPPQMTPFTGGFTNTQTTPPPPTVTQAPAPKPPVTVSPPTAATPPVPPPPAPPAVLPPGTTGQTSPNGPIGLNRLKGVIETMLGAPGAYDNQLIQSLRQSGMNNLDDVRRAEEDRLRADAASRGVYRGSGLSTSLGDLSERYTRAAGDLESNLLEKAATSRQSGLMNAINSAFGYGQGEMQNQANQANILAAILGLGMQGQPTIPGAVGDFGSLPQPQPVDNSWIYQLLGTL